MVNMLSSTCGAGGKTTLSLNQTHFAIDADSTRGSGLAPARQDRGARPGADRAIVSGETPTQVTSPAAARSSSTPDRRGYLRSHYIHEGVAAVAARYADLTPDDQLGLLHRHGSPAP